MRGLHLALGALAVVAACGGGGDDEVGATRPAGAPAATPQSQKDDKNKLVPRKRVEDQVACFLPDKADPRYALFASTVKDDDAAYKARYGNTCTPDGAPCDKGYCMQFEGKNSCIRCPERDRIRHDFGDRDFVAEQNRDPFQSFVVVQPGLGGPTPLTPEVTNECKRKDQLVATTYSYADLRLVGIVAQGTVHKALMMDSANVGHIVKRGDCVGKEKAIVVDIAAGNNPYIKFVVHPEQAAAQGSVPRTDQEKSIELHPGGLQIAPPSYNQEESPPPVPVVTPQRERLPKDGASAVPPPPPPAPAPVVTPAPAPVVTPAPVEPPEHPRR